jgi:hypothetical protein
MHFYVPFSSTPFLALIMELATYAERQMGTYHTEIKQCDIKRIYIKQKLIHSSLYNVTKVIVNLVLIFYETKNRTRISMDLCQNHATFTFTIE